MDESFSAEEEEEDVCRICQSPEEPGNPLRYPCLCRGSIKFVHHDCLRTWLNRGGNNNKCEVCGRRYSFVPVYSEDAPERLPCDEFLLGVLLRAARFLKLIILWTAVILFNTLCISLLPVRHEVDADARRKLMTLLWANFYCSSCIAGSILVFSFVRIDVGDLRVGGLPGWFLPHGGGGGVVAGVLHFLWKYLKVIFDWYFLKLMHFLGQPHRVILVPPVTLLDEFGVIRRLLFFVDDHVFAGLAISVFFCTLGVLLPISVGWVVIATVGGSYLSGIPPFILGHVMLQSIGFAYFGILYILEQNPLPVLVRRLSLGFRIITLTLSLSYHVLVFLVKACKNRLLIKDAFVLFFKIGALPWIVGWFLQICISPMFGAAVFQRFEIISHKPCIMMSLRWVSGFYCLITANDYMEHIQRIMHKRAFWYLVDVSDPDYKITKLNLRHIFFALACHGMLLVILFRLPIRAITLVSPSVFPLELWINYESPFTVAACGVYFNLMHAAPRWLVGLTKPIKLMLLKWIVAASSWLQLRDLLLLVPRGEGFHHAHDNPWFLWLSLAEGSMVTFYKSQNDETDIREPGDKRYRTRIAIMLMLAALSLFLVSTIFMVLPLLVGRVFSDSISFILRRVGIQHDDICAFWIGCYILRAIYISICFAFDHILTGRTDFLLNYILIRTRKALIFSIWIFIIPGLLGLLIDLMIIIPLRVPLDESPLYFLFQDWWIGLVVLHLWIFLPFKCLATKAWRRKLERIRNVGIYSLPSMWLLRDVIGSIINTLLTTLSIPYVLVKSLLPLLGFSQGVSAATERFIWPALLALIAVWFVTKLTLEIIIYLHELMFNERYMVGERVGDLTEDL